MSWDKVFDVSWGSASFRVKGVDHDWRRRLTTHEYPNRDGGEHEDLKRKPLAIRLRAIITGPNWRTQRQSLIDAFNKGEGLPLIHPLLGTINARLAGMRESMDENKFDYITFDLEFIEDQLDSVAFLTSADTMQAAIDELVRIAEEAGVELSEVEGEE